jgi:rhodanese-related sulfurtransferase
MNAVSQIDATRFEQLKQEGNVVLLDVRTDAEVARGKIAGAKHIPLNELPGRLSELDPQAVTIVYCQSGGRSAQACAWLGDQGFARVHNLQGGVLAWVREGLPLEMPA